MFKRSCFSFKSPKFVANELHRICFPTVKVNEDMLFLSGCKSVFL